MIRSFTDKRTAGLFAGVRVKGLAPELARRARSKLLEVDRATSLSDMAAKPGNRLEMLRGDRDGQHSVRVNSQWRLCFIWRDGHVHEVEFVDYH